MSRRRTPEQRAAKRARYRQNNSVREDPGEHGHTPDPVWAQEAEAAARSKARALGLYRSPTAGVLAQPDMPYRHLLGLASGDVRRRCASVTITIVSSFYDMWERNLSKRSHKRGYDRSQAA